MAVASALFAALSARLLSLVSMLLVAYLALVVASAGVALALSPFRAVDRTGLAIAEAGLLVLTVGLWWVRGRPGFPLRGARVAAREVSGSPLTLAFVCAIGLLLGYELLLAMATPPNNWDSLAYHLPRAAAWAQHRGYFWIPNSPYDPINEFQPLAEQQILFGMAATGSTALVALPQFVAELAILVAVYGLSRRLGFDVRPAVCASCLLATFSLVVLQATTEQNDLVAASFPVIAACLLISGSTLELVLAGAAVGLGVGAKLTTLLVLPVLVWLAWMRGRRALMLGVAGAVASFVLIGVWGFVLNQVHTGHLLGKGGGRAGYGGWPSYPRSLETVVYLVYHTMDLSALSDRVIYISALVGVLVAGTASVYAVGRSRRHGDWVAWPVAIPFLAPLVAIAIGGVIAFLARWWGHPARGVGGTVGGLTHRVGDDWTAFGPLGALLWLGVPALTAFAYWRGRADRRQVALAAAAPLFLILLALYVRYDENFTRFLLVPVVLAAPLLSRLFQRGATTAAFAVAASIVAAVTVTHQHTKPLNSPYGRPWTFSQSQAIAATDDELQASVVLSYAKLVPPRACVGAVLTADKPSYILYGPNLEHPVHYLPVTNAYLEALREGLFYVVVSNGPDLYAENDFLSHGWKKQPLGHPFDYEYLLSEPHATTGTCT
jgi:hypothetical protein